MPTFEVFLRRKGRDPFEHAGSLDAPDGDLALLLARESYCRRAEGEEMWVVDRRYVLVAPPSLLAVNVDKPHRHSDGAGIAERRRARRS